MADQRLASSLLADQLPDSVVFTLHITNSSARPVEVTFPTGQSFDFVVYHDGMKVWRWSDDMMFTQAVRHETLLPDETRSYSAAWRPGPGSRGEYAVRGMFTAQDQTIEQRTRFRIP